MTSFYFVGVEGGEEAAYVSVHLRAYIYLKWCENWLDTKLGTFNECSLLLTREGDY